VPAVENTSRLVLLCAGDPVKSASVAAVTGGGQMSGVAAGMADEGCVAAVPGPIDAILPTQ